MKRTTCFLIFCLALLASCCKTTETDFKPMYMEPLYEVAMEQGRSYADFVEGYWASYPDTGEDFGTIYKTKLSDLVRTRELCLDMDLYYPKQAPDATRRPLLLLIHGGAFYNGDKQDLGYPEMAFHFAQRGYVVASINYRLGFKPKASDVDRAGYRALQDAYAAVCYLIDNADEFGIDTDHIFAAGTSAGAITALNLAFMREENRPESTRDESGWGESAAEGILGVVSQGLQFLGSLFDSDWGIDTEGIGETLGFESDLGPINAVADSLDRPFQIKAVVNMWGAVHDLAMLKNSPETAILSFHGDADPIVPYDYGYPFNNMLDPYVDDVIYNLPGYMMGMAQWMREWVTSGRPINEWAFNPMYGSKAIHDKASSMGMRSELHTMEGGGHSLHVNEYRNGLSDYYETVILPEMTRFLCEEMTGGPLVQVVEDNGWYKALNTDNVAELHWVVEGDRVTRKKGKDQVKVKFNADAPSHSVTACGRYRNGVEFRVTDLEHPITDRPIQRP